jgi:hypothetical protein
MEPEGAIKPQSGDGQTPKPPIYHDQTTKLSEGREVADAGEAGGAVDLCFVLGGPFRIAKHARGSGSGSISSGGFAAGRGD